MNILRNQHKVKEAFERSESIKEAIEYLGKRPYSHSYRLIRETADKYDLEIPQYDFSKQAKDLSVKNKTPLSEILVKDSTFPRRQLKKRLLEVGLLDYVCYNSKCSIKEEWLGKPIVLHIDHINGIHNDNRLENLRLLCPNCHSQTETYAGRGKKNRCTDCQTEITSKATRCLSCSNRNKAKGRFKIEWPSIEELKKRVNANGFLQVGRELGVSDNAIRKHIANHS